MQVFLCAPVFPRGLSIINSRWGNENMSLGSRRCRDGVGRCCVGGVVLRDAVAEIAFLQSGLAESVGFAAGAGVGILRIDLAAVR